MPNEETIPAKSGFVSLQMSTPSINVPIEYIDAIERTFRILGITMPDKFLGTSWMFYCQEKGTEPNWDNNS